MIAKKNKGADLEKRRFAFFQIGLVISGSLILAAFEYSTASEKEKMAELLDRGEVLVPEVPPEVLPEKKKTNPAPVISLDDVDSINIVKRITARTTGITHEGETIIVDEPGDGLEVFSTISGEEEVLPWSSTPPVFPGGEKAMYEWLGKEIKYPTGSIERGEEGIVYSQFVVNKNGSIQDIKILRGNHTELNHETLRVIKKMPRWKPGEHQGKKVRVQFTLPIKFMIPK